MIVDTNVLISAIDQAAADHERRLALLSDLSASTALRVNEIIFAELAGRFRSAAATKDALDALGISLERLSLADCHRAGQAFQEYRRRKGPRATILPDFLIGAQAEMRGWPLLTSDRKGFESYFSKVELIDPSQVSDD